MAPAVVLLIFRILAAILLLAFLGTVAWFIYQDIKASAIGSVPSQRSLGMLRVMTMGNQGSGQARSFALLPVNTIGRAANNTVVLDDEFVSSHHAMISLRGNQWWLEDMGSRNGTQLNDLPLETATVVSGGDIITIGNIRLKLELHPN